MAFKLEHGLEPKYAMRYYLDAPSFVYYFTILSTGL
jgi:hypothetical protein